VVLANCTLAQAQKARSDLLKKIECDEVMLIVERKRLEVVVEPDEEKQ
jgi:hypothetical protein